jgi:SAM-dependent methyltransferase
MIGKVKKFLLSHEPFKPMHMGIWTRSFYFSYYLRRKIDLHRIQTILDAGCGKGYYLAMMSEILPRSKITGYDILESKEWKQYAKPDINFIVKDLRLMSDENAYDLVISIDSLEHIPNNKLVLKNFYRALHPGGYLYFHIPCGTTEKYIFPRKFFKEVDEWAKEEHIGEQYPLDEWKKILNELGFKILLARHTFTFWGHLAWELETILRLRGDRLGNAINILLMPFYKFLCALDLFLPIGGGDNLIIARKR